MSSLVFLLISYNYIQTNNIVIGIKISEEHTHKFILFSTNVKLFNASNEYTYTLFSTFIIGYIFSLYFNLSDKGKTNIFKYISIVLSSISILSLLNEWGRFIIGYDFNYLIQFPFIIYIIDFISLIIGKTKEI